MMPLSEIFFLAIVMYLLYRFVFNFLIPVARTTRQVRQQFRNMQDAADAFNQQAGGYQPGGGAQQTAQQETRVRQEATAPQAKDRPTPKAPLGDYIDFEEIKD